MLLEFSNGCILETNAIIFIEQFPDTISVSVGKSGEFAVFTERNGEEKEKQAFSEVKAFLNILRSTGVIAKASNLVEKEGEILEKIQNFVNTQKQVKPISSEKDFDFAQNLKELKERIQKQKEKDKENV